MCQTNTVYKTVQNNIRKYIPKTSYVMNVLRNYIDTLKSHSSFDNLSLQCCIFSTRADNIERSVSVLNDCHEEMFIFRYQRYWVKNDSWISVLLLSYMLRRFHFEIIYLCSICTKYFDYLRFHILQIHFNYICQIFTCFSTFTDS